MRKTDVLSLIHAPQYAEFVLSRLSDADLQHIRARLMIAMQDPRLHILRHLLDTLKESVDAERAARAATRK